MNIRMLFSTVIFSFLLFANIASGYASELSKNIKGSDNECSAKIEKAILGALARFGGVPLEGKLYSNLDGIRDDTFVYSWDPSSAFLDAFADDTFGERSDAHREALEDEMFQATSLQWARVVGSLCPQIERVEFNVGGGNYVLVSFKADGFEKICSAAAAGKTQHCP